MRLRPTILTALRIALLLTVVAATMTRSVGIGRIATQHAISIAMHSATRFCGHLRTCRLSLRGFAATMKPW